MSSAWLDELNNAELGAGDLWQHRGDQWRLEPEERRSEDEVPPVGRDDTAGPRPCGACLEPKVGLDHLLLDGAYSCDVP